MYLQCLGSSETKDPDLFTWNSAVLGLEICTALVSAIFFPSLSEISSREHLRGKKTLFFVAAILLKTSFVLCFSYQSKVKSFCKSCSRHFLSHQLCEFI